ncbi:hypothetical protein SEA_UNPHAZED_17 [Microbacterium phage Unphazed]|uniref:Uncharacterized protein n=4 Tax=Tinytimothyvirus alex44 TaxID=2845588 RepID=A0A7G9A0F0_9CAUD|nr:hypothetical protein SEA_ARMAWEN_16 [Microbacterium phage ArMaWen]QDF16045.1 hypothetical protein SEA_LILYLOU_17 [Microbacterium phage LilyLou]QJD52761.1 hypothetical protein SEA_UNPHAZED_17 [Microbacterium phage Unphazed]QJD52815.1 hypothetical protein SEA_PHOGO_17 [Microbacterium phage Phogo]QNL30089.1 hypothetical protein SEA_STORMBREAKER_16 [Microbacterium phage Stormbreaker]UTN92882.1 hypothetical protein SEA_BIRDFEEDER_16 [Microbacterium phage Birdfeeder]WNM73227.1 hypothetical prote
MHRHKFKIKREKKIWSTIIMLMCEVEDCYEHKAVQVSELVGGEPTEVLRVYALRKTYN